MKTGLFIAAILAISIPGFSATLHVPGDFLLIQEAIDAAQNGDTIRVAPGTYDENLDFLSTAVTLASSDGPWSTILDGGRAGPVATLLSSVHDDSVIEGFTITNGYAYHGAGIHLNAASPVIRNNRFLDNEASQGGGGIYMIGAAHPVIRNNTFQGNVVGNSGAAILTHAGSAPLVEFNRFLDNEAQWSGGGLNCYSSDGTRVENNYFEGNRAGKRGGGMRYTYTSGEIRNNVFIRNAARVGGAVCCSNSASSIVVNNVVCENLSTIYGGGIYCGNAKAVLTNNTIFGNRAVETGGGLNCVAGTNAVATNNIFWNNDAPVGPEMEIIGSATLQISRSVVDGGQSSIHVEPGCTLGWGSGMIDADPLFMEPGVDDYHLRYDSPCREAGTDTAPELSPLDFEGDPRIEDLYPDMGADEFHPHLYTIGEATPGGAIQARFAGTPGAQPVGLWLGSGVLEVPQPTAFGPWFLEAPWVGPIVLAPIPSSGVLSLPATLPPTPPGPYTLPLQAFIENRFTNMTLLVVR